MKKHYDFSNGVHGRFFRGSKPMRVVVNVDKPESRSHFEVFSDSKGKFHFRLTMASSIIFTSEHEYRTKDDCIAAISIVWQDSLVAPTVFHDQLATS